MHLKIYKFLYKYFIYMFRLLINMFELPLFALMFPTLLELVHSFTQFLLIKQSKLFLEVVYIGRKTSLLNYVN